MKNKITVFMLAAALMAPAASLWASAGDSSIQGANGTTTGSSQPSVKTKKHHGHHHKKPKASVASNTSATSNTPATK